MAPFCHSGLCHRTGEFSFGDPHSGSYVHGFLASKWFIALLTLAAVGVVLELLLALLLLARALKSLLHKRRERKAAINKEEIANSTATSPYNSASRSENGVMGQQSTAAAGDRSTAASTQPAAAQGATETRSGEAASAPAQSTTEVKQVPATTTT